MYGLGIRIQLTVFEKVQIAISVSINAPLSDDILLISDGLERWVELAAHDEIRVLK